MHREAMRWREIGRAWGTSEAERQRPYPCDTLLPEQTDAWYRGVTVHAAPAALFPWLCQLRAAPYSYDWIDNFGRRSPRELQPGLTELALGQRVMYGFELLAFEPDVHLTIRARWPERFLPPLVVSYCIAPDGEASCRLLLKLALVIRPGLSGWFIRRAGPWLDWFMMRRQLLNLKAFAEAADRRARQA